MKKIMAFFFGIIMILSFSACGNKDESNSASGSFSASDSKSVEDSSPALESEAISESKSNGNETAGDVSDLESGGSTESGKVLVVYFSATGNTEKIAFHIANITGGTLLELIPVNPYTSEDLDYRNSSSRVSREYNDESLRDIELTEIMPEKWSAYKTVFLGYPIWWGIAAWPVNNFVKENDFTGKTVIPFATSASSPIGNSGSILKAMAGTGNWLEGNRFYSGANESTVKLWIDGLHY